VTPRDFILLKIDCGLIHDDIRRVLPKRSICTIRTY
jgi:hypothetical protein